MNIKLLILLICFLTLLSCLFGCHQENSPEVKQSHLTLMLRMSDTFESDNNAYVVELENQLGIDLEIVTPPQSSYHERLNVVMVSNDIPDIIQFNWNGEENFSLWALNGKLKPIDLEKAENIAINIPQSLLSLMQVGGDQRIYGVPGRTSDDYYGVVIRKDWLDTLGLSIPKSLAEFTEVLKAFTLNDPDGDYRENTYGMTSWRLNNFLGIFGGAFQMDYIWNAIHLDMASSESIVALREGQLGYMPAMDYIHDMYQQGYLDLDFTNLQSAENKFVLGQIGMLGAFSQDTLKLEKELQRIHPKADLIWILPPGDQIGKVWNFTPEAYGYSGAGALYGKNAIFAITSDAEYDTALNFLDAMNTPDMILLANLGVKGIHYESYDASRKKVTRTEAQSQLTSNELFGISDTYRGEPYIFLADNPQEAERLNYYWLKGNLLITRPVSYSIGLSEMNTSFLQRNPFFKEKERSMAISYVVGSLDRNEYIKYLIEENLSYRSAILSDIQQKYHQLTN